MLICWEFFFYTSFKWPRSFSMSSQRVESGHHRSVVELLINAQPRLFAYTFTLFPNLDTARDILQDANCKLLEKSDDYDRERDFVSWACGIIRNCVMAYYRDHAREKLVFGNELINLAADVSQTYVAEDRRHSALSACYQKLSDQQRMLIDMRYGPDGSVAKMAKELSRSTASISTSLHRIRRTLESCIRTTLQLS